MKPAFAAPLSLALAALTVATPAAATGSASSASSATSSASMASIGSLSNSVERSSASSTQGTNVAAGDYRVVEVADADHRPQAMRLTLQAVAGSGAEGEFYLWVPRDTLARHGVDAGQVLTARTRPYGIEFAHGNPRQAFFLVMDDAWYRELRTTPVTL
jgi:hypothetical protein